MTVTLPQSTVRKASPHDAAALGRVLAEAFYDDPIGIWFMPDDDSRLRALERFFREVSVQRVALPHGEVRMTEDGAGAAVWTPPGSTETSALEALKLLPVLLRVSGRGIRRVLRGISAMEAVHPHEPHWYLQQLAVLPSRQGQGIGSALMRPVLERADSDRMPAYLEATTPRSRALYERQGFRVLDVMHMPDDGPPMWRMWREPIG